MKKNILALTLASSILLFSGCAEEILDNAISVKASGFVQSGTDFNYTLEVSTIVAGTLIHNLSLSDDILNNYSATIDGASNTIDTSLMDAINMTNTVYDFVCTNDSGLDTSTHRYFKCTDQYTSGAEDVFECLLEKGKSIPLAVTFSLTTDGLLDSARDIAIGTLAN